MTAAQRIALRHPCLLAEETAHPRFWSRGLVDEQRIDWDGHEISVWVLTPAGREVLEGER